LGFPNWPVIYFIITALSIAIRVLQELLGVPYLDRGERICKKPLVLDEEGRKWCVR
jgi:hypothetical protein